MSRIRNKSPKLLNFTVRYRNVKYARLELTTGRLVVILPKTYQSSAEEVIQKHIRWVMAKARAINSALRKADRKKIVSDRTEESFRNFVFRKVRQYSEELALKPGVVYFRKMKTKWGSCSCRGNLMFNRLLKFLPNSVISYVVFHELVHLRHRKHGKSFWQAMRLKYKNWEKYEEKLLMYWFLLHKHLTETK